MGLTSGGQHHRFGAPLQLVVVWATAGAAVGAVVGMLVGALATGAVMGAAMGFIVGSLSDARRMFRR